MVNEKMMILKMLEEGKITAEEASRLMDAAGTGASGSGPAARPAPKVASQTGSAPTSYAPTSSTYGSTPTPNSRPNTGYSGGYSSSSGQGLDDFAADLSRKFDTFTKDMEPKIQRFTETVVEKTAGLADSISKSLSQPPSTPAPRQSQGAGYSRGPSHSPNVFGVQEKNFELFVQEGFCELNLMGLNGDILINGYNGDKITAKVNYKPKFNAAAIELMKLGDKYYLNYDEDNFEFVTIDAYIPEKLFKNIRLETINGNVYVSTVVTDTLAVNGINTKCELKAVNTENLVIDTSNGSVTLFNIYGKYGKIECFNGAVNATSVDMENMSLLSNNGPVTLNVDYFNKFSNYTWVVEASNGKLVMNVPSSPELGYYVKAKTSLNNVKLGLTGMNYAINNANIVEAKSHNFDDAIKKIKLSAETSNAPLVIN